MPDSGAHTQSLQRMLERERSARGEAERILESKSMELFTANSALLDREQYMRAVFEAIQDGILIVDDRGCIESANPVARAMAKDEHLEGRPVADVLVLDSESAAERRVEARLVCSDRSILPVRVTRSEIALPEAVRHVLVLHDLSDERAAASALRRTAFMDQLTGLGNRASMIDRYETRPAVEGASRFAVLVLDIQRFGRINDALGRASGDLALREIALRLRDHVRLTLERETRLQEYMVTRVGGDEFAVLVRGSEIEAVVDEQIGALLEAVGRPFTLAGIPIAVDMHIGYCFGDEALGDINAVFDRAVLALDSAGDVRIGAVVEYQPEMAADRQRVVGLEGRIIRGLDNGEFQVHFQPRVDLVSGLIVSAEALLRWHHPERGVLPPGEFIPIAEQSALIVALDELVLDHVLAFSRRISALGLQSHFSVNVSGIEFAMLGFADKVNERVSRAGVDPSLLEFEIKESVITSDVTHAIEVIDAFTRHGFSIALDDFGTGHSSLNRLTELHVDVIKLDQRFLWGATTGVDSRKILEALVALAAAVDATLVMEGAEDSEQIELLKSIGVRYVQGFAFSPPVDEETFLSLLRDQPWTGSALPPGRGV